MENFEKLGAFYLGKNMGLDQKLSDELCLLDSKDLTTHAVCVGMTGSGKTGLCVSLLEEAAMDNIPALIIDPKGDMTNLLLNFPDLSPEEFLPWINESEASKKNLSPEEYAAKQAELWKNGLAQWGQSGERIRAMKDKTEFSIYTPGSTAGLPVSILSSFAAPDAAILNDMDAFGDRIEATVSSLLGLLDIDADPIQSREHILLSTILKHFWQQGKDLDLPTLILSVQKPPFKQVGVFDIEQFFPANDRFKLAITMNNLMASPGFQSWLQGEALNIDRMLYNQNGKPRHSIFYIAHLSDTERMFFVSLLLNQVLSWVRSQNGTSSLRALLYFDELFGYLPPIGNPSSKKPLMTLLKQARAFGLGVVMATQNPVDLDYKGLSNTGCWFIGRLQTERDRERVIDGLLSAGGEKAGFDKKTLNATIAGLDKRVFLLHNVHEDAPVLFHTRWAMSYLCGPLTRPQIQKLKQGPAAASAPAEPVKTAAKAEKAPAPPMFDPDVTVLYAPVRKAVAETEKIEYRPCLWAGGSVSYSSKKYGIEHQQTLRNVFMIQDAIVPVNWEQEYVPDLDENYLLREPDVNAGFAQVPAKAKDGKQYTAWKREYTDHLYKFIKLDLFKSPTLDMVSNPGESERDFRIRLSQVAREQRDEWTEQLRDSYAKKIETLEKKLDRAKDKVAREEQQASQQKLQTAISIGTTLLGAFMGRKKISSTTVSRAGTVARQAGRSMKESQDIKMAEEIVRELEQDLQDLQEEFQSELDEREAQLDMLNEKLETESIKPFKKDILVQLMTFVWVPCRITPTGDAELLV